MFTFSRKGRQGPRTQQQRIQELLRKAGNDADKYYASGRKKEGKRQPRPITLPKVSITE